MKSYLASLAERFDCAVLIVRHLAKGSTSKAIYRGLGSIDLTAAARSVLLAGHDPDNRDSRAIVQIKSNLGPLADPVGYSIEAGQFAWTGSTGLTAGQILAPEVEDGALSEARRFLRELLSEGAKPAGEVEEEAKAAGISASTLRRAKKALGIKVSKVGFDGAWHWSLPVEEGVLQALHTKVLNSPKVLNRVPKMLNEDAQHEIFVFPTLLPKVLKFGAFEHLREGAQANILSTFVE